MKQTKCIYNERIIRAKEMNYCKTKQKKRYIIYTKNVYRTKKRVLVTNNQNKRK